MSKNKINLIADYFRESREIVAEVNQLLKEYKEKVEIAKAAEDDTVIEKPDITLQLEELKTKFGVVLEYVELSLITNKKQVLFAQLISDLGGLKINYNIRGFIDLVFRAKELSLEVNPLFLGDLTFQEITTYVVGDIMRMIYAHPSEFSKRSSTQSGFDPEDFMMASDMNVTDVIMSDYMKYREGMDTDKGPVEGLQIPDDMTTVSKARSQLEANAKRNENIDYYYEFVKKFRKKDPNSGDDQGESGGQSQSEGDPQGTATPGNDDGNDTRQWQNIEPEEVEAATRQHLENALNSMTDNQRGNIPGRVMEAIEEFMKPPIIDWKQILRRYVGGFPAGKRKTSLRLHRTQPYNPLLKGTLKKKHIEIVVVIDTSGSMSTFEIEYSMSEMARILENYETRITVIECDMEIGRVYEVTDARHIKPEVTGRGGTYFSPAVEYINANKHLHRNIMVYFTDGGGERELTQRPLTRRNLWVLTGSEHESMSLTETYGEVKRLHEDPEYQKLLSERRGSWW